MLKNILLSFDGSARMEIMVVIVAQSCVHTCVHSARGVASSTQHQCKCVCPPADPTCYAGATTGVRHVMKPWALNSGSVATDDGSDLIMADPQLAMHMPRSPAFH